MFDKTLSAIQDKEDELCRSVRDIGRKMRNKVTKSKRESEMANREIQSLAAKSETEMNGMIQNSKGTIESADAEGIMSYESQNMKFRYGLEEIGLFFPKFQPSLIDEIQLHNAFEKI